MGDLAGAPVTFMILAANVLVSAIAFTNREFLLANLLTTQGVKRGEVQRVVTSGFIHGSLAHLAVNMLTFYFFAPYLEGWIGAVNLVIIYFGALLLGSGWALVENWRNDGYAALGASGAVSGIVLAFCMLHPLAELYVFFAIPMPAIVFAVLYIVISASLSGRANRRIAHEAHLGGAIAGIVLTLLLVPGSGQNFIDQLRGLFG